MHTTSFQEAPKTPLVNKLG